MVIDNSIIHHSLHSSETFCSRAFNPISHMPHHSPLKSIDCTSVYHPANSSLQEITSTNYNINDFRMVKLVHAHRVGMKAMDTMRNRNLDDPRSYAKFTRVSYELFSFHYLS